MLSEWEDRQLELLERIADALERAYPPPPPKPVYNKDELPYIAFEVDLAISTNWRVIRCDGQGMKVVVDTGIPGFQKLTTAQQNNALAMLNLHTGVER